MTPEQQAQLIELISGLPLHALLLIAVIVLWRELRKTRAELDDCLRGNRENAKILKAHQKWISDVEEMSE